MAKYTPDRHEKITSLREKKVAPVANQDERKIKQQRRQKHRQASESEKLDSRIKLYKLNHLARSENVSPYDVMNPTRYPAVPVDKKIGNFRLKNILKRYQYVMKSHGITPSCLKMWREQFMLMTRGQLAALVRVSENVVRNWEKGITPIPFSMWWVMHVAMQDPEYFLTRPGFHDFYIEYVDGNAFLCSHEYPEIRWTPTDLYFNRCALDEVIELRKSIKELEESYQKQIEENTLLRELLKAKGVTGEIEDLHEQLGELVKRIQTADVLLFQPVTTATQTLPKMGKREAQCF